MLAQFTAIEKLFNSINNEKQFAKCEMFV